MVKYIKHLPHGTTNKGTKMSKNDTRIKELMVKIEDKKHLLCKPKLAYKTNALFQSKVDGKVNFHLNLNVATNEALVEALAYLISQTEATKKAKELLKIEGDDKWSGYDVQDWIDDMKLKAALNNYNDEINKIKALEAKLKLLVSEEVKTEMELDEITKML